MYDVLRLPAFVGRHPLHAAVGVLNAQLRRSAGGVSP
jgi:hypothetical protein